MAGVTKAALAAAIAILNIDGIQAQFRRDTVLLSLLKVETGRGENCTWLVKGDGRNTAGEHSEGEDSEDADFSTHTRLRASLNWAEMWAHAKISGLSEAVADNGDYAGGDIVIEELDDANKELAVKISTRLYNGNQGATPTQLAGLARVIDSSDDNFAGIDTGDNTWWTSGENTVTSLADVTIQDIRTKLIRPVKDVTGRPPDLIVTPGQVFDVLCSKVDEKTTVTTISTAGTDFRPVEIATLGQKGIAIDGVPIIEDRHCTALTMYGISTEYLKLRQLRRRVDRGATMPQIAEAIQMLTGQRIPLDALTERVRQINGMSGLVPTLNMLAKTGDSQKFMLDVKAQTVCRWRGAHSKLTFSGA